MRKDELEALVMELRINQEVEEKTQRRVRRILYARCGAAWAAVTSVMGMLGWLVEKNSERFGAAFRAFWDYSGK